MPSGEARREPIAAQQRQAPSSGPNGHHLGDPLGLSFCSFTSAFPFDSAPSGLASSIYLFLCSSLSETTVQLHWTCRSRARAIACACVAYVRVSVGSDREIRSDRKKSPRGGIVARQIRSEENSPRGQRPSRVCVTARPKRMGDFSWFSVALAHQLRCARHACGCWVPPRTPWVTAI